MMKINQKLEEKKDSLKRTVILTTVVGLAVTTVVLTRKNRELQMALDMTTGVLEKAGLTYEMVAVPIVPKP